MASSFSKCSARSIPVSQPVGWPARGKDRGRILRRCSATLIGACWVIGVADPSIVRAVDPAQQKQLVQAYHDLFEKPASVRQSERDLVKAQVIHFAPGFQNTTMLCVAYHELIIPADPAASLLQPQKVKVRCYNGTMIGPTIRVKPGTSFQIIIQNALPPKEVNADCDPAHPANMDVPHGWNCTNLHTHGLHVSPNGNSDNVYQEIGPGTSFTYQYDLRNDHVAGTFWYHPHKHGSVALQVTSGMAGGLIVEGGLDEVLAIKAARERIMVFQQLQFRPDPGQVVSPQPTDIYRGDVPPGEPPVGSGNLVPLTLINGQLHPVIRVAPGSVERWRLIHGGIDSAINLAVVKDNSQIDNPTDANYLPLQEIAVDGIPRGKMVERLTYSLYPGYRWDVLFKAPDQPGVYFLIGEKTTTAQTFAGRQPTPREYLAKIVVAGAPHPMPLPSLYQLAACVPCQFSHVTTQETTGANGKQRVCALELRVGGGFVIDKCPYDRDRIDRIANLDHAEEWHITGNGHPFHIHVNPFEQLVFDSNHFVVDRIWRDTLFVNSLTTAEIVRMRFRDFTGETVLHCHILDHEDKGMMENIMILGANQAPGNLKFRVKCDPNVVQQCAKAVTLKAGSPAPAFDLPGTDGRRHRLTDLSGRKAVLVFFRGLGCLHCV
jgi:FtsP/CotA-like multicopper oxidase with cupredoxin domain